MVENKQITLDNSYQHHEQQHFSCKKKRTISSSRILTLHIFCSGEAHLGRRHKGHFDHQLLQQKHPKNNRQKDPWRKTARPKSQIFSSSLIFWLDAA